RPRPSRRARRWSHRGSSGTRSTSSCPARSRSARTAACSARLAPVTSSARSRSSAPFAGRRPCRPPRTPWSWPSAGWSSSPPCSATWRAPGASRRSSRPGSEPPTRRSRPCPDAGIGRLARMSTLRARRERLGSRAWADDAVARLEAEANRSADTHLHTFPLPAEWGIDLYLKDESVHPTGSLKHRLARSLFLYGLCNGWITERTTIVEASSGSTAVSEAYFARFLGLPFVAVMPAPTSPEKITLIEAQGGSCHLVDDPRSMVHEARRLAD